MERKKERPPASRYLAAILAPLVVASMMQLTWPFFEKAPATLFLLAVIFCAWYGGLGPGLLSIIVSFLLADYFFVQPYFTLWPRGESDLMYLLLLVTVGSFITILSEMMHKARRRAESLLASTRRSEERYRSVVETTSQAVWSTDADGHIYTDIPAWREITGQSFEAVKGTGWTGALHASDRNRLCGAWSVAARQKIPYEVEGRVQQKDGGYRNFMIRGVPVFGEDGETVREWITTASDITERKRAEARFGQLIEHAPNGMVMVDREGKIILINAQIEKSFGYERDELIGRPVEMLVPERLRANHSAYRNGFLAVATARPMGSGRDLYGLRKDGSEFPVEIGLNPLETEQGIMVLGTIIDITERKRANEALRASQMRFSAAFNASPVSSVIATLDGGRYVAVNDTFLQLTGYRREEVIGRTSAEMKIWPTEQARAGIIELLQTQGHIRNRETRYRMKSGEERIFLMSADIIDLDGQPHLITASIDITERKRAEEEVHRLNEELEQRVADRTAQLQAVNKELEAFSYSVSHDLRAPLRHINGFSQALLEDYEGNLDEIGKGYLQEVRNASQEMAQLIDDVLQLARVTRSEMRSEVVNLSDAARAVMADLQKREPARAVFVSIEEGLSAVGDKRLLRIVLVNLLGNAWKFTSLREGAEIWFGREERDGETVYIVRDNGAGFDMAYVNKLFGAFQRLHTASEFEGTGIGLATVQRIVNRHGGRVWAEGKVNEGAAFFFTIPNHME